MLADDRTYRAHALVDKGQRNSRRVDGVLDHPAQAVGDVRSNRVAERRAVALDVVGGTKQDLPGDVRQALQITDCCASSSARYLSPIQFVSFHRDFVATAGSGPVAG